MITLLATSILSVIQPVGHRVPLGERCYGIVSNKDAGAGGTIGSVYQSVERRRLGKVDGLAIVVHQRLANGKFDMRDEFLVRRGNLLPLRLDSWKNGVHHAHLDYNARRVTGWKMGPSGRQDIAVDLPTPTWDGNLWGITFASLPVRANAKFRLPIFQYDDGLGAFSVNVKRREKVRVGGAPLNAWVLDAGVSPERRSTYYVSSEAEELGYRAGPMSQFIGGDCSGLK